jgi:hypothetical protein
MLVVVVVVLVAIFILVEGDMVAVVSACDM